MTAAEEKVKAIHSAVNMASDVLLQDASVDFKQLDTLRGLGFINSENAKDIEDFAHNRDYAREYRQSYPQYKFITEHQLDKIRKIYNLMEGNLSAFKGNIPAKNITDMQNCKIKAGDVAEPKRNSMSNFTDSWMSVLRESMFSSMGVPVTTQGVRGSKSMSRSLEEEMRSLEKRSVRDPNRVISYQRSPWLQEIDENPFVKRPNQMLTFKDIVQYYPESVTITAERALFDIPARDLDPIVTVAVKGGYLIITAWGAEASDPDVQNPAMN